MGEPRRIHVIYAHPLDFPNHHVVRAWVYGQPEFSAIAWPTIEGARRHCERLGLVCFNKDPASDPVIVEVWAPMGTEWPFGMKTTTAQSGDETEQTT